METIQRQLPFFGEDYQSVERTITLLYKGSDPTVCTNPRQVEINRLWDAYGLEISNKEKSPKQALTRAVILASPFSLVNQLSYLAAADSQAEDIFKIIEDFGLDEVELETFNPSYLCPNEEGELVEMTVFGSHGSALQLMKAAWANEIAFQQSLVSDGVGNSVIFEVTGDC